MKKDIIVKVLTPNGERHIVYRPVEVKETTENVCVTKCPYGGKYALCEKISDPRVPNTISSCFMCFCQELKGGSDVIVTPEKDIDFRLYIPVDGTIEDNLSDVIDVNQDLIRYNPSIKLSKVIDTLCPEMCPDYKPDHCNCTSKNLSCFIKDLIFETEPVEEDKREESKYEGGVEYTEDSESVDECAG